MRLTILLFANLADLLGHRSLIITLDPAAADTPLTVDDLLRTLERRHPALSPWMNRLAVAIDERYAPRTTPLRDGMTIALSPPVSGG